MEKGGLCGTGELCEGLRRCGPAEIPVCGEAGAGQRFEQWLYGTGGLREEL